MTPNARSLRTISDPALGDHLCFLYETDEEHRAVLAPFLREGLERGEKVLYVADDRPPEAVLEYLRAEGVPVDRFLSAGQLKMLRVDDVYLRAGVLDPGEMIGLLRRETGTALDEGYRGLRLAGEMTWALRAGIAMERVMEFESRVNAFLPGSACLILCQYDRRRFDPAILLHVLTTHPGAVVGREVYDNFYYLPPEDLLSPDVPEKIVRHWLDVLASRKRATQAEEALEETNETLHALIQSSPLAIVAMDLDGNVTMWNPAAERIFGWSEEDVLGRFTPIVPGEQRDEFFRTFAALLDGQPLTGQEVRRVTKAGRPVEISLSAAPLRNAKGVAIGVMAVLEDISEHKKADAALRESEERYRLLFDANPHPMWVYDLETLSFLAVNDSAVHHYGFSRDEFLAMTVKDIRPSEDVPALLRNVEKVVEGRDEAGIWRHRTKDGTIIKVEITSHTLLFGGRRAEIVLAFDVTERVRMTEALRHSEAQLRQSQKMEAVGRLAGGVAHDFNNLLTAINGYSDLLLQYLGPHDPLRHDVEEIRKAGERAAGLTHQLLAFSRRQVLQPKVLELNTVVGNMDRMLRRLIGEDIELRTLPGTGLWRVKADPGQIEQVIANLAVNARDAMPTGGKLTVETANVELDEGYARRHATIGPGPYVMLAVADTGFGMDAETQSHLFEPFFTTKEKGKGTGLGLSTVYGIVKQSGGFIYAQSEVGHGTTFRIYLPRAEAPAEAERKVEAPEEAPRGRETVLLVEDEDVVRELVREVLRRNGYTVLDAGHGGEALLLCERHAGPIHLMVTDVVMPRMSGRELAERLRALRPGMRVLYMSGYTEDAIVQHGVLEEGVSFIQKPFQMDGLARKVREVLDQTHQP